MLEHLPLDTKCVDAHCPQAPFEAHVLHAEALPFVLQHRPPLQLPLVHWLDEEHCPPSLILLTHLPPDS